MSFTQFNKDEDIVQDARTRITRGLWSNGAGTLTTFVTASGLSTSSSPGKYYYNVYVSAAATGSSEAEFSVAYAHVSGGGALSTDIDQPTKAIYGQYATMLSNNPKSILTYGSITYSATLGVTESSTFNDFIAISIKRTNLKSTMDPGNWQLTLKGINNAYLSLIDNSGGSTDNVVTENTYYGIVSGSVNNGIYNPTTPVYYGKFYPKHGVLLIDPRIVSQSATFVYSSGSDGYKNNHGYFFNIISGGAYFEGRSAESISSTHYFVRVKNKQYNFTNNPTFVSSSDGVDYVLYPEFQNDPKTFITTVGLYNDFNELLAVAKLSKPVKKSFSSETLIKARIDF